MALAAVLKAAAAYQGGCSRSVITALNILISAQTPQINRESYYREF